MFNYEKFLACISLIAIVILTTGVNRCQESYNFAVQSSVPTGTATDDGSLVTATPSGSRTVTATATATGSVTASGSATATPTDDEDDEDDVDVETSVVDGNEFFQISKKKSEGAEVLGALSQLNNEEQSTPVSNNSKVDQGSTTTGSAGADSGSPSANWLGQGFLDKEQGDDGDADDDSFADSVELSFGTDPSDSNSFPPVKITTDLSQRLMGTDDDGDGLPNSDEAALGSDPRNVDSDGDGVSDGAEIRSGTDPLKNNSIPVDSDGDGLSDVFEKNRGLDWRSSDSDGDGLRDDYELSLGTDIMHPDSDNDGIPDGKEVQVGSDPTIAEQN